MITLTDDFQLAIADRRRRRARRYAALVTIALLFFVAGVEMGRLAG